MAKECADCRAGEHDNLTDDVTLVVVRAPVTKKLVKRAYLCSEHIETYLDDGFEIVHRGALRVGG